MRRHAGREGGRIAVRITEPRTRRGALTALSTLGETYREGAATPAPLEQAVVWGEMQRPVLRLYCACTAPVLVDKSARELPIEHVCVLRVIYDQPSYPTKYPRGVTRNNCKFPWA